MHKIFITICLIVLDITVRAQTDGFNINIGLTVPTNFGTSANIDDPIGMGNGFSAGIRFQHAIGTGNLHYFAGVSILHNGMSKDANSTLQESKELFDVTYGFDRSEATSSIEGSSYWFIPLLSGLNYIFPVNESLSLWGEVGTGVLYQIITNQTYKGYYSYSQSGTAGGYHYTNTYTKDTKIVTSFDNAVHWALHFGIGVSLSKKLCLGVNYDWFYGKTTMRNESITTLDKDYNSGAGHNHTSSTDHPDPTVVTGDAASSAMFTLKIGYSF